MKFNKKKYPLAIPAMLASSFATFSAHATENNGSVYPMGAESYLVGVLPPPGVYGLIYSEYYDADKLKDNNGDSYPFDFHAKAAALVPRVVWSTDLQVLGGNVAMHVMAPLLDVKTTVASRTQHKTGFGDMTMGLGLGYHYNENFHAMYGFDIAAPTGGYDKNDVANLGRNYWMIEPVIAMSWISPVGVNADIKIMYDFNRKNMDTNYLSGQELHFDYSAGWRFSNGLTAGIGGYTYVQVTDDEVNGHTIDNNRGRAIAVGPTLMYNPTGTWFVTAKWQKEFNVSNRPEGNAYWLKVAIPL